MNQVAASEKNHLQEIRARRLKGSQKACVILVLLMVFSGTAFWAGLAYARRALDIPIVHLPTLAETSAGVRIFDRHDHYITTVYADRDKLPVPLSKMSPNIRNAVMAAEDHTFKQHHGLDFIAIARAAYTNWRAKRTVEGASTLTQQLARNLFLNKDDRSLQRKLREAFIAWDLETQYSKPKIMEAYLNEVYFGSGVHGIERAASQYFNKHASQLTISESAFLAGLIRCPTGLGCPEHRSLALKRRDDILQLMEKFGYISPADAAQAQQAKLAFHEGRHRLAYPHYVAPLLEEVSKEIKPGDWNKGYKVYCNLDIAAQKAAEKTITEGIKKAPKGINQGALVTMSVKDGSVLAIVGGVGDFSHSQWNRALHPHTAGSSFKPFVYLTGLINGAVRPGTIVEDAPMMVQTVGAPPWTPKNFDGKYKGWMTCRDALAYSRNICAARVGLAAGIPNVVRVARAAGITAALDPFPSLSLGSCAVTPFEMATAYSTLARGGKYMQPRMIRRIETDKGQTVCQFIPVIKQTLPAQPCAQIVDLMQDVVRRGTGTQARLPGIQVAGKTGTADKGKDIWFVGFTPETVTAVWGGSDLNKPVPGTHVTGGIVMAKIWNQYMTQFVRMNKPTTIAFVPPQEPLINSISDDSQTEMIASGNQGLNDVHAPSPTKLLVKGGATDAFIQPAEASPRSAELPQSLPAAPAMPIVKPTHKIVVEQWHGNRRVAATQNEVF